MKDDVIPVSSRNLSSRTVASRERLGLAVGFVGVVIFGGTLPATRLALDAFSPAFITFGRAVFAAGLATLVLVLLRRRLPVKDIPLLLFAGLMLVFGFPLLSSVAMQTVPAAHGAVVLGMLPMFTSIFATLFAGERPSPLFWLCGLAGTAMVVTFALRDGGSGGELSLGWGDLALLLSCAAASAGYVASGVLSRRIPGWEVICWALVLCLPLSLAGALTSLPASWPGLSDPALGGFLYLGAGSMFLGFFAWNIGLGMGGIARVGQLQLLQSFITLMIAAMVLDEPVGLETIIFALAVAAVVAIGRRARITSRG